MDSDELIGIDYFSDVLCVWAWIAQPRLETLQKQWRERIRVHHRYVDVFGDCHSKIPAQWGGDNGFEKFSSHVVHSAGLYEDSPVNPQVWRSARPRSSMPAHLVLKAAQLVADGDAQEALAARIRSAFFCEAKDIGDMEELMEHCVECGLDVAAIQQVMRSGEAMGALSGDLRAAQIAGVKGSPTWVLNEGRQMLYGNVGYRILNANLEELLNHPADESSWC
jgi:predicted DsbA family dithiol-disulfide isomerase